MGKFEVLYRLLHLQPLIRLAGRRRPANLAISSRAQSMFSYCAAVDIVVVVVGPQDSLCVMSYLTSCCVSNQRPMAFRASLQLASKPPARSCEASRSIQQLMTFSLQP